MTKRLTVPEQPLAAWLGQLPSIPFSGFGPAIRTYLAELRLSGIRRECLDQVIVLNEQSLRRTLRSYFSYYYRCRLHLSLHKDSPDSRPVQSVGKIIASPEVGGLHRRYQRAA
jgi:hypothetical protein